MVIDYDIQRRRGKKKGSNLGSFSPDCVSGIKHSISTERSKPHQTASDPLRLSGRNRRRSPRRHRELVLLLGGIELEVLMVRLRLR